MPLYFFDLNDGDIRYLDDVGQEAPDDETARLLAVDAFTDLMRDTLMDDDRRILGVEVRDQKADVLYRATLTFRGEWVGNSRPDLSESEDAGLLITDTRIGSGSSIDKS